MPHQMFFYLFELGAVHKSRLQLRRSGALCDVIRFTQTFVGNQNGTTHVKILVAFSYSKLKGCLEITKNSNI